MHKKSRFFLAIHLQMALMLPVSAEEGTLPDVNVSAPTYEYTYTGPPSNFGSSVTGDGIDLLAQMDGIKRMTSVCIAPVSKAAKSTTKNSDVTDRWLAAQEVFNNMQTIGTIDTYREFASGLKILIGGVKYDGFIVSYADGSRETWAINPSYKYSSVKLIDTPFPDSINKNTPSNRTCNTG
ncbi:hypothetical protein [Acidovorax sp. NCPPB 4044]|uniref:hypothetical protein n=1 Tax=Acidovorax sp. NCPPB 4044 TaxID=2940490 RepID=UPI0023037653|nr:hypothetical protein [Acidovorax sp. NCPPB 4044]MDA8523433.1 hypothetical protein [Acidovorax sp. NCPPB 4044]